MQRPRRDGACTAALSARCGCGADGGGAYGADRSSCCPLEALGRIVDIGWRDLDRNNAIAQAAGELLTAEALKRTHRPAHRRLRMLVDRGRRSGDFPNRRACRMARDSVHGGTGAQSPRSHVDALRTTLHDLFSARRCD